MEDHFICPLLSIGQQQPQFCRKECMWRCDEICSVPSVALSLAETIPDPLAAEEKGAADP